MLFKRDAQLHGLPLTRPRLRPTSHAASHTKFDTFASSLATQAELVAARPEPGARHFTKHPLQDARAGATVLDFSATPFHPLRTLDSPRLPLTVEQRSSGIPRAWTKTSTICARATRRGLTSGISAEATSSSSWNRSQRCRRGASMADRGHIGSG
jgi:hypothetical protein